MVVSDLSFHSNSFVSISELFQALFNILYEEQVNCRLSTSQLVPDKTLNWNRINASICFNYLQQQFYLVKTTMETLAKGKSQKCILKLLRVLLNVSQSNFGDLDLDDDCIRDIADVITADADPNGTANYGQQPAVHEDSADGVDNFPRGAIFSALKNDDAFVARFEGREQQHVQEYDEEYEDEEEEEQKYYSEESKSVSPMRQEAEMSSEQEISHIKNEADAELAKAQPIIVKAQQALSEINQKDFAELIALTRVSPVVLMVCQMVFYLYVDPKNQK